MTNRTKRSLATTAMAVLLLPTLASTCYLANLFNPIAISLITTRHIANETNEKLVITPLCNFEGQWKPIHSGITGWLALPSFSGPSLQLDPGKTRSIHKIDDRLRMDAIAIVPHDGRRLLYELRLQGKPIEGRWDSTEVPCTARITTLSDLPTLPAEISDLSDSPYIRVGFVFMFLTSPLFFLCCYRIRRRNSAPAQ